MTWFWWFFSVQVCNYFAFSVYQPEITGKPGLYFRKAVNIEDITHHKNVLSIFLSKI